MTGTERKVFQKYYPPDYDPSKLRKAKPSGGRRNRQFVQRVMTPFNMQCNTCNEYIYKGKKFNMKRETVEGETYLGLKLFRFYFKCPNCLAEITFKTDLENTDYQAEYGATRLFEAFKLYKDQQRAEEAQEEEDKKDPMKMLEKRTMQSRAEMEAMGHLEELQEMNRGKEGVDTLNYLAATNPTLSIAELNKLQEEADERQVRALFGITEDGKVNRRIKDEDEEEEDVKPGSSAHSLNSETKLVELKAPFKKPVAAQETGKRRLDQKSLLSGIVVKKKKDVPPTTTKASTAATTPVAKPVSSGSAAPPPPSSVDTGAKHAYYARQDVDFDPIEADNTRRWRPGTVKIGLESRFPDGPKKHKATPGPDYDPGFRPEVPNPPKFSFGVRREIKGASPLVLMASTPNQVGPGSYIKMGQGNTSTMPDHPAHAFPKDRKHRPHTVAIQKNQTYDTRSSIGSQVASRNRTMPLVGIGRARRDAQTGLFKSHMSTQQTTIRIQMPKF